MELVTWAHGLAEKKLADALPRRWQHVQGVARQARRVTALPADEYELLVAAAILHDVGYAPDLVDTKLHGVNGARFLASIDADERLVHLVALHSAARHDAVVVDKVHLLDDYVDEHTAVRDALWWADMTTGPDGQLMSFHERMAEVKEHYSPEHPVARAIDGSWDERLGAVERTEALLSTSSDH